MPPDEPSGPDLDGVVADANAVGLDYVVIGGFSVIYHGYIRATKDSDLLVGDGPDADAAVLRFLERVDGKRLRDDKFSRLRMSPAHRACASIAATASSTSCAAGCHRWTSTPSPSVLRQPTGAGRQSVSLHFEA
jgi:hypothetical protein